MIRKTKKDRKERNLKNREMKTVATDNIGNIKTTTTYNSPNRNWSALEHGMDARIGKFHSLMMSSDAALSHPSTSRLLSYTIEGCPANCGENWKLKHIKQAALRGAHRSALHPVARTVLRKETMEQVRQGFAKVVSFKSSLKICLPI